jgi:hypothetical protein
VRDIFRREYPIECPFWIIAIHVSFGADAFVWDTAGAENGGDTVLKRLRRKARRIKKIRMDTPPAIPCHLILEMIIVAFDVAFLTEGL